jgi:high affinity Mn2+ porin
MRVGISLFCLLLSVPALAAETENWSLHGQATFVEQYHPAFKSAYLGPNSMDPQSAGRETVDLTLYAGLRLWRGGEAYANPEIDQGFGLSNTVGAAGFPSGEAYKVGKSSPYFRLQRLFFRQTFDLGGDPDADIENIEAGPNQLGGSRHGDNLIFTGGKISTTDIFDTNTYAHDPKSDFLNWSLIDAGAFDYAADAWGYSYGLAGEWTQDWWTLRAGLFNLSRVPNTTALERDFSQFEIVGEAEGRHTILGRPGKIKLLGFVNRGRMGSYADAVRLAQATGTQPGMALVRRYTSRPGGALNVEQEISDSLGAFARVSLNDGSKEAYEFTEINRSVALGLSVKGTDWGRSNDTWAIAGVVNELSDPAKTYFAAGGMGILIGDGQLRRYGTENILETYYDTQIVEGLNVALDYQLIANPAYNADRGPVSVLGLRLHGEF